AGMADSGIAQRGPGGVRVRGDHRHFLRLLSRAEGRRPGSYRRAAIRMMHIRPSLPVVSAGVERRNREGRREKYRFALFPLVAFALLTCAACSGGEAVSSTPPSGRGGGQTPPVPVTATAVEQKPVPLDVQAIGTVIAASTVAVRAQITGELMSVNFKEGDEVQEGQVLFTLDKRP